MEKKLLSLIVIFVVVLKNYSQDIWQKEITNFSFKKITDDPENYQSFTLKKDYFLDIVQNTPNRNASKKSFTEISLPVSNQDYEIFQIFEAPNLNPTLSKKFPSIKAYIAKSVSSNKIARLSYSKHTGLSASIYTNKGNLLIKPIDVTKNSYALYSSKDSQDKSEFECETIEKAKKTFQAKNSLTSIDNDGFLRKYRLAVATTGQFSGFFLTGNEVNDIERKAVVLAAINNSLSRINGIFERDFGVTMELVDTNDQIIFLDSDTDPFISSYNAELQNTLDTIIGTENYDVGHLFLYENSIYGNAGCIACVCTDGEKGSAFTAHSAPDSDDFNMIASHEFGHQFGGYHVQSSSSCRSSAGLQEVEPGSGSSIMGYAGICSPNVQENADDYFNYVDIRDVLEWTRNNSSCAELIATGNNDPVADAGNDYTIPVSTPFMLTGTGTDINSNDILTYCWEQNDPEDPSSSDFPQPTWIQGPLFRSKSPVDTPVRYIPQLEDVVNGNLTPTWEVLPSVERDLDFAFTVRDNATFGPKTASDLMTISVVDSDGSFYVTSQTNNETWNVGDEQTITWNVAGTNQNPFNATNVDILLSLDGGYTYPHTISTNIPNNGTAEIIVPSISDSSNQARVMVKPVNNIFYAINSTDITIQTSEFALFFTNQEINHCKTETLETTFIYNTFLDFDDTTTFSVENLPENITATFIPSTAINDGTEIKLILNSNNNTETGLTNFNVIGNSSNIEKRSALSLNIYEEEINTPNLIFPENNTTGINVNTNLEWSSDENINNYIIDIATDVNFSNIIEVNTLSENTHRIINSLDSNTTYYWRVLGENTCNTSNYSTIYSFTTACSVTVTSITGTNISTDTIDLSWIDTNNTSSWEVEAVLDGEAPTGNGINTTQNPFTLSNLNSNTNYDVYIRSSCSSTNFSEWIGPYNFTTLANYCNGDKFYDTGGVNGTYSNGESIETLIFPIDSDVVEINFESFQLESNFDYLTIYDGNDTNAPLIGSYTGTNSPGTIKSKTGQGITFVFTSDSSVVLPGWEASVQCSTITCPAPTDFNYTNITDNSADLSWISNGEETDWIIEHGESGFIRGEGIITNTTTNTITIENLNTFTSYDFYITAVCGDDQNEDNSLAVGPLSLKTNCGVIVAPYTFNVEEQNTFNTIENCWIGDPVYNQANYVWQAQSSTFNTNNTTGPFSANSGDIYFKTTSSFNANIGDEASLLMPVVNVDNLTSPVLNFYAYLYGKGIGSLHIDVYNNGTWTNHIYTIKGEKQTSNIDPWNEYYVDLSSFSGDVQVRFRSIFIDNDANEIDLDDISIIEKPDCIKPTNVTFDNISFNSLQIQWQNNNVVNNNFTIQYGESGFTLGGGTQEEVLNNNSIAINNLNSNTSYDFYIRTNCDNNTSSEWSGPYTRTTPANYCNGDHFYDTGGIDGTYANNENYTTTIYPSEGFDQVLITFNSFLLESCCDYLRVYDGIDTTAPLIGSYNGSNSPGTIISTNDTGALTFAFTSDTSVTLNGWDATVTCENSSCLTVSDLTTSSTTISSTELDWVSRNDETDWVIEYGETGFTQGTGNKIETSSKPYLIENLESATTYDVYVSSTCNETINSNINSITFSTIGDYCGGDHFYDTGGADNGYAPNENYTTTIYPSEGNNALSVTFNSIDINFNDFLIVLDGESENAPLIAAYTNINEIPNTIISNSSTGALTFIFNSANSSSAGGWDATINCEMVTCRKPSNIITNNITMNTIDIELSSINNDADWIIEYGETGFTPGIGIEIPLNTNTYTLNGLTPNTTYDIYAKTNCGNEISDYSNVTTITTVPDYCNGDHFYDTGGINGNYSVDENYITTIYPSDDFNQINVTFNSFEIEPGYDFLTIYDGESINANVIGTYTGLDNPGSITSTNSSGALTFQFLSDHIITFSGWDATVTCLTDDTASVLDNTLSNFSYYPNPIKDILNIKSDEDINKVEVYNLLGQKVISSIINKNSSIKKIDLANLASGTYFIKIYASNKFKQLKIVKD